MTAPSYTTDLNDFCLMESGDSFFEFSGYALGDNAALETDWYLQGNSCASDEANNKTGVGHSIGFDYGSTPTFNTGDCLFAWMQCMAGNAMDTYANGGYRVLMGSSTSVFYGWYVGGSNVGRNPYGGWTNVVVDPTQTADDTGHGSPTSWRYCGVGFKLVSGIGKGRPINADAYRWGRGELIIEYGEAADYGTFDGIATQNDGSSNKWGLFSYQLGSYLWKGLLSFGNSTNACDFRDSNVNIIIDETPKTYAAFNKIEINNASSRVDWTGVNITALQDSGLGADSGVSPGSFEMVADATVNFTTCVFTDMSTFIFDSNATLDAVTFRRCGQVTQAGGDFDNCIFDESPAATALLVDNPDNVDNCTFNSDGNGHAIELTSACAGNSYTLTDFWVSGYAASDGSTGDEAIFNDSGGAVTINIDGGSGVSNISVRNGSGASTSLVANYSFTVTGLESGTEVTIVTSGTSTVLHHTESASTSDGDGKYQITYSHSGGASVDVLIHHIDYKPDISNIYGLTLPSTNSSAKAKQFADENYENP